MPMRRYLVILVTIGLLAIPFVMAINGADDSGVDTIMTAIVVGISAIWAGVNSSSIGWGLFVVFFWPIAFPAYLLKQIGHLLSYLITGMSRSERGVSSPNELNPALREHEGFDELEMYIDTSKASPPKHSSYSVLR